MDILHIPIGLLTILIKFFKTLYIKISNGACRPKIKIELRSNQIMFKTISTNQEEHQELLAYPGILITNKSRYLLTIQPQSIKINNESYICLLGSDRRCMSLYQNPEIQNVVSDSTIYNFYRENWNYLHQEEKTFDLEKNKPLFFPLKLTNNSVGAFIATKNHSRLFFPKNKISIEGNTNGKIYEYGINRSKFYELQMKYFANNLIIDPYDKIN